MTTVAVIDYGMGNIRSVSKALEYVGGDSQVMVSFDPERILRAERIVLPGVGALRDCMAEVQRLELDDVIKECLQSKPFLGICLGMQALMDYSSENEGTKGLGIFPGRVLHFNERLQKQPTPARLKIPHMGWNTLTLSREHPLFAGVPTGERGLHAYFVHSFQLTPASPDHILATTDYGAPLTAAVARDNLVGVQFHPEKSQRLGLALIGNFLRWRP